MSGMPRVAPPDRLEKLLVVAASAFVRDGFRKTQMDDIADSLGVSKGTVYRYVDSKETLFGAVISYVDRPAAPPGELPLTSLSLTNIADDVAGALADALDKSRLSATMAQPMPVEDAGNEVEELALDLFETMARNRTAIMVLDRCAAELPELIGEWFGAGRYATVDLWHDYLQLRADALALPDDIAFVARTIVETIALWAVKMPWDPSPRSYDPSAAGPTCAALVRLMVGGGQR